MKQNERILRMAQLAMFSALIVVLQVFGGWIRIGDLTFSLVLVPIVIGAVLFGMGGGAFLGFVFGIVVTVMSATGMNGALVTMMWTKNPFVTAFLCIAKGVLAGLAAAAVYKALSKIEKLPRMVATVVASVTAPIVNTGIFLLGMFTYYNDILEWFAGAAGFTNIILAALVGLVGINFVVEFLLNLVLGPTIHRIITVIKTKKLVK